MNRLTNKVKLAKDIQNCDDCPLYQKDCTGDSIPDSTGLPKEPPCATWNDDEEIYEGMYDYDDMIEM